MYQEKKEGETVVRRSLQTERLEMADAPPVPVSTLQEDTLVLHTSVYPSFLPSLFPSPHPWMSFFIMNVSQSSVCWAIFQKPFFFGFIPCFLFVPHHSPNQPCRPSVVSASLPLTHKHWHLHTHTHRSVHTVSGRLTSGLQDEYSSPPLTVWISRLLCVTPDPSPFPESCQSKADCCVGFSGGGG